MQKFKFFLAISFSLTAFRSGHIQATISQPTKPNTSVVSASPVGNTQNNPNANVMFIRAALVSASLAALMLGSASVYAVQALGTSSQKVNEFLNQAPQIISKVVQENIENSIGKSETSKNGEKITPLDRTIAKFIPELHTVTEIAVRTAVHEMQGGDAKEQPELGIPAKISQTLDKHLEEFLNENRMQNLTETAIRTTIHEMQGGDAKEHPELGIVMRLQTVLKDTVETQINLLLRGENHRSEMIQSLKRDLPEIDQETKKILTDHIRNAPNVETTEFVESLREKLVESLREKLVNIPEDFAQKIPNFLDNVQAIQAKPLDEVHQNYIKTAMESFKHVSETASQYTDHIKKLGLKDILSSAPVNAFGAHETLLYQIKNAQTPENLDQHFENLHGYIKQQALDEIKNPNIKNIVKKLSNYQDIDSTEKETLTHKNSSNDINKYTDKYKELIADTSKKLTSIKKDRIFKKTDKIQPEIFEKEIEHYNTIHLAAETKMKTANEHINFVVRLTTPRPSLKDREHIVTE